MIAGALAAKTGPMGVDKLSAWFEANRDGLLTGVAVGRWFTQSGEAIYTIVLDAPTENGLAIIDCPESQLIALPAGSHSRHLVSYRLATTRMS